MITHRIVGLAADHAGFEQKEFFKHYLMEQGVDVRDFGTHSTESMDYPDTAHPLAEAVLDKEVDMGLSFCGTGNGMAIALNRVKGIRAGLSWTTEIAALIRRHNDANVCVLPARFVDNAAAQQIVDTFLSTEFEGGRHIRRIEKIEQV
jgi:ribose 5-phosphate isomerase B